MASVLNRLLVLLIVVCVAATAFVLVAGDGRSSGGGADVPGVDLPDPGGVADRVRDRVQGGGSELRMARCRDGVPDCRAVRGRIVFVEAVDPDGDGDLHVVVADGSVTAPGLTSIDVRPGLRPERDPSIGDVATAAGPVQTGSKGQSQIHALSFRVR